MKNFIAYMLRNRNDGKYHNYGALTEWRKECGSLWYILKDIEEFHKNYPDSENIDIVPFLVAEIPK